jgi:hypothetical protein
VHRLANIIANGGEPFELIREVRSLVPEYTPVGRGVVPVLDLEVPIDGHGFGGEPGPRHDVLDDVRVAPYAAPHVNGNGNGAHPNGNGAHPNGNGAHPNGNGAHPKTVERSNAPAP